MSRKFKSPGKHFKEFGQVPAEKASAPLAVAASSSAGDRSWLASRIEMLNIVLFTFFAILGYVQYFFRHAPAANSLSMGIGFTAILLLYLFMVRHRQQVRNRQ